MKAFQQHTGLVGPMDRANVDTDIIIPKQYLKRLNKTGYGRYLFDEQRYLDEGWVGKPQQERQSNSGFPLNQPRYQGASVLLTRKNFGCGSSREHAPWALDDYGFRAIIAPSFADIFFNNCCKNGLLPVVLAESIVDALFLEMYANEGYALTIDLATQTVSTPSGESHGFEIDSFRRQCLLDGLDDIDITLQRQDKIQAFEAQRAQDYPWVFGRISSVRI
ncbi:MAG: 3-isopropylmalate dehydratase small subunit [Pseudomonadota bacterium]